MIEAIYILCALTSVGCAILLARHYFRFKGRLLLFSSIFFSIQSIANLLLVVDLLLVPYINLSFARSITAFVGVAVLIYGLITETMA